MRRMAIKLENVGIAVRDLEATIAFFTDLGLTLVGRDTVSGEWTDTAVGLDGNHAKIAMLQTPDGNGRLELFEYIHPAAIETEPTRPNRPGPRSSAPRSRTGPETRRPCPAPPPLCGRPHSTWGRLPRVRRV